MKIFYNENEKLINIKPNNLSNYSNYKKILSFNKNKSNRSFNNVFNKMYLKKNISNIYEHEHKPTSLIKNITNPIVNPNEFSSKKKNEKSIQRYYINEKNNYKNLLKKFTQFKEKNNLRNFSFSNNLINFKVSQFEEKSSRSKESENDKKSFWNEQMPELNVFRYKNDNKKKNNHFFHKTNINLNENLIDEEEIKIKINDMKSKGFNNILNTLNNNNLVINWLI